MIRPGTDVLIRSGNTMVLAAGTLAAVLSTASAQSLDPGDKQMLALEPNTRIEQRCNARGMGVVGQDHKNLKPDELVAYAFADTAIKNNAIRAPGAAIRSGSNWYHMSYSCETSDDGLRVKSFEYSLGSVVPKKDWAEHGLVAP